MTAMHRRRPSKPASVNSASPLKTRRLGLLLLCAVGQALAVSSPASAHHSQSGAPASEAKSVRRLLYKSLPGSGTPYQLSKTTHPAACPPQFVPMLLATLMPPSQPPPRQIQEMGLLIEPSPAPSPALSPQILPDHISLSRPPLSRVPPTLTTAGATGCPPWCLSRDVRSWACETLDCQPCLSACLAVEGYQQQQQEVSQLRSVLPVRQSGNAFQDRLVFSTSGQQLTVCTCAKCGSTSVFRWLYESIYGQPFVAQDPLRGPWVQNVQEWKAPPAGQINTPSAGGLGSYNFTIVRDPLERYFSAWKSKIQCNRSDVADGNRIVPKLLKLAGLPASKMIVVRLHDTATTVPAVSCLRFADFALALRAVHVRGAQDMLDRHLLPQTLTGCSQGAQKTIAEFEKATSVIAGRFGLREVAFPHAHAVDEKPALRLTRSTLESELCAIVAPEYAWMEAAKAYKKRCVGEQGYRPLAMPFLPSPQVAPCALRRSWAEGGGIKIHAARS